MVISRRVCGENWSAGKLVNRRFMLGLVSHPKRIDARDVSRVARGYSK